MRFKQLFINFAIVLVLSVAFLPSPIFATGTEESELPDQSQANEDSDDTEDTENPEDTERDDTSDTDDNSSSDKTSIGGGLNVDNENQPPVTEKPAQPETPSVSKPLPQPEDTDSIDNTQTTKPITSSTPVKPTLPTAILRPQIQTSKPISSTVISGKPTIETTETEENQVAPVIIPTAPSDSVAPAEIETPRTGMVESQKAPVNLFAIILLVLSAITIIAAGIVNIFLSKAAQRDQTAI